MKSINLRQLATRLSPRGWAIAGGSVAVAILFLVLVFKLASAPSYTTLLTGLDPAQTGKITSALDTKGIAYEIQNGGTALAVNPSQTSQARVALATAGLLGSQQPGMSLFDSQQLGASNFQQQVTYQRALEGQLEQTIETIQGVSSAQVQLVLPNSQDQLFADNTSPSTGAVELSGSSSLNAGAVKGIAQLVASSVPGLTTSKVTITGGNGALLWPNADSSGATSSLLAKDTAEQQYNNMMAAQVDAMLATTLGPGKAQVEINSDLDVNQATSDALVYGKKGVPLQQQSQNESLNGAGAANAAGTTGTIPAYATTSGGGKSKYANTSSTTTFGVDKTVTHSVIASGAVNRQSVSVLVAQSVPASAIPALRAAVTNAVGLVPARGDTLSFGQIPFAKAPAATPAAAPINIMGYAKYGVLGVGVLAFLFFITRLLRRREHEVFARQPTWLTELESPRPLAELEAAQAGGASATGVMQLPPAVSGHKRQVADMVERNPDRVAQQVRAWMTEED
jgi:flagellar M-ring protein FliF